MPEDYKFRAPNGTVFTLRGESPPTPEELEQVYSSLPKPTPSELRSLVQKRQTAKEFSSPGFTEAQQLNEALRAANLENIAGATPFFGAGEAFNRGYKSGTDVAGEGILGKALGSIGGTASAALTALNPLGKIITSIAPITQATAESLGGQSRVLQDIVTGNQSLNPKDLEQAIRQSQELSQRTLSGEQEVLPNLKEAANSNTGDVNLDTAINLLNQGYVGTRKDPVAAAAIVEGLRNPATYKSAYNVAVEPFVKGAKATVEGVKGLKTTTANKLDYVTNATNQGELFQGKLRSGAFNEAISDISALKKEGGVAGVEKAVENLNKSAIAEIKPIVQSADPAGILFNPKNIVSIADDNLATGNPETRVSNPETRSTILKTMQREYIDSVTPENIMDYVSEIGGKLRNFYKSPDKAKYSNRIRALEATRDALSSVIKTTLDEQGVDPTLWSKYGARNELADSISKNYGNEVTALSTKKGGRITEKGVGPESLFQKAPIVGKVLKGAENIAERITGGEPAFLDKRVDQIFKPGTVEFTPSQPSGIIDLNELIRRQSESNQVIQ